MKVIVRKQIDRGRTRYRYEVPQSGPNRRRNVPIRELENAEKLEFRYAKSMSEFDKSTVISMWFHKIKGEICHG